MIGNALRIVMRSKETLLSIWRARGAEVGCVEWRGVAVEAEFVAEEAEGVGDLLGVLAFAAHAAAELRVVHFSATHVLNAGNDAILLLGPIARQPIFEDRPHGVRQPQHLPIGALRSGLGGSFEDRRNLCVGQTWDDWGDHHAHRYSGG